MGLQDYEWLKRAADLGDAAFAKTAAASLVPNAWQVPDDGAAFERAKLQLVSRVNQLMNAATGPQVQGGPPAQPASNLAAAITSGTDPVTTYVPPPPAESLDGGSGASAGSSSSGRASASSGGTSGHLGTSKAIGCGAVPPGAGWFPLGLGVVALWLWVRRSSGEPRS
jgi:hypothetical protein